MANGPFIGSEERLFLNLEYHFKSIILSKREYDKNIKSYITCLHKVLCLQRFFIINKLNILSDQIKAPTHA